MPYDLVIKEEARLDMLDAYQYYEQQQPGLGERFVSALQKRVAAISDHPEYYSYIDSKQVLRDVAIDKFPFVIVYAIAGQKVTVYAIRHTHKRPKSTYPE